MGRKHDTSDLFREHQPNTGCPDRCLGHPGRASSSGPATYVSGCLCKLFDTLFARLRLGWRNIPGCCDSPGASRKQNSSRRPATDALSSAKMSYYTPTLNGCQAALALLISFRRSIISFVMDSVLSSRPTWRRRGGQLTGYLLAES